MGFKVSFVRKQTVELELDEKNYPDGFTPEQMAEYELENGTVDLLFDSGEEEKSYKINASVSALEKPQEESVIFPTGCFIQRGSSYFKVCSNENDFVGRVYTMKGEVIDPFYFEYNGMKSQLVTDPALVQQLSRLLAVFTDHQVPKSEELEMRGFILNSYPEGNFYELNITDFDRATEVAELAGVKFDHREGVHHVILQCGEQLDPCYLFCDNEYWELSQDVFFELVRKL